MLPAVIVLVLVLVYPMIVALYSSFFDLKILNLANGTFIGLDNYITIFSTGSFWSSLLVTGRSQRRDAPEPNPERPRPLPHPGHPAPGPFPRSSQSWSGPGCSDPNFGILNYLLESIGLIDHGVNPGFS